MSSLSPLPTLYGIPNCDKVRAARAWLRDREVGYVFHDFKKSPPTLEMLAGWATEFGTPALLNTRGTTWRQTPEKQRPAMGDSKAVLEYLQTHASAVRRPILKTSEVTVAGFDPDEYARVLAE